MRAYIVVDLGFGDAGKGLLTDTLVRRERAGLVVRYNGGAQAGHNVVTPEGRHHTFSQFGSGTFVPGVRTYLSRHVVVHPTALLAEGDVLRLKGVTDVFSRLRLSDHATVITPFHQAANRLREMARGSARHGSCGVGVGEAVEDALQHPADRILAGDLANSSVLRRKLRAIREREREKMAALCGAFAGEEPFTGEFAILEREEVLDNWVEAIARFNDLNLVVDDSHLEQWLNETDVAVFEGAQGILLDADAGFHPYTTWSRCTSENALSLLAEHAPDSQVLQIGVCRCYAVRHGPGPLPTETGALASIISEHNRTGEWQGAVRYGWFDSVLTRYALQVNGGVDTLAVTHLDAPPRLGAWKVCTGYRDTASLQSAPVTCTVSGGLVKNIQPHSTPSLDQRACLTDALADVEPGLEDCAIDERSVIKTLEANLGMNVGLVSRGPSAHDVSVRDSLSG